MRSVCTLSSESARPLAVMSLMAALAAGAAFYAVSYVELRRALAGQESDLGATVPAALTDAGRAAERYLEFSEAGLRPAHLGIGPLALEEADIVAAGYMAADSRGNAAYLGRDGIWSHDDFLAHPEAVRHALVARMDAGRAAWEDVGIPVHGADIVLSDGRRVFADGPTVLALVALLGPEDFADIVRGDYEDHRQALARLAPDSDGMLRLGEGPDAAKVLAAMNDDWVLEI